MNREWQHDVQQVAEIHAKGSSVAVRWCGVLYGVGERAAGKCLSRSPSWRSSCGSSSRRLVASASKPNSRHRRGLCCPIIPLSCFIFQSEQSLRRDSTRGQHTSTKACTIQHPRVCMYYRTTGKNRRKLEDSLFWNGSSRQSFVFGASAKHQCGSSTTGLEDHHLPRI